jgi:hypothetical protein
MPAASNRKTESIVLKLPAVVCLVCLLVLPAIQVLAQDPVIAFWEIDEPPEGGWTVGDPISLRLQAIHSASFELVLPELPKQWGAFEIVDQSLLDPVTDEDGNIIAAREVSAVLWAPGEYETPPVTVRYRDTAGELRQAPVTPISVTVVSVLPEDNDERSTTEKRDLKPQASLPRPPWWPWILGGIFIVTLLFFAGRWLFRQLKRRRGIEPTTLEPVDDRFPEEIANKELDRISALNLPAQGEFKHHYTLVTACMRTYLEGIYGIPAMDQTTRELMAALHRIRVDREATKRLGALLDEADLIKFAKLVPSLEQAYASVSQARDLIDITKPDRTPTEESQEENMTVTVNNA